MKTRWLAPNKRRAEAAEAELATARATIEQMDGEIEAKDDEIAGLRRSVDEARTDRDRARRQLVLIGLAIEEDRFVVAQLRPLKEAAKTLRSLHVVPPMS